MRESEVWGRGLSNMKDVYDQHITSLLTHLKISGAHIQNGFIFIQLLPLKKQKKYPLSCQLRADLALTARPWCSPAEQNHCTEYQYQTRTLVTVME